MAYRKCPQLTPKVAKFGYKSLLGLIYHHWLQGFVLIIQPFGQDQAERGKRKGNASAQAIDLWCEKNEPDGNAQVHVDTLLWI